MDGLISRSAAIAEIEEYLQGLDSCISEPNIKLDGYKNGLLVAIHEINDLPSVDAIPVEWLRSQLKNNPNDIEFAYDDICINELIDKWQKE